MSARVVLINPSFQRRIQRIAQTSVGPPLGLAYLAAAARAAGHSASIVDANALDLDPDAAAAVALAEAPDVVGLTATTPTIDTAAAIAGRIKARAPGKTVICGGPHTTALPTRSLEEFPGFDVVARGEGEQTLPRVLGLLAGERLRDLARVPGLAFRGRGGEVIDTGVAPAVVNLDGLAPPARDLLPMERYRCPDSDAFSTILAMRGCPCGCVYCAVPGMFGRKMRYRSPAAVAEEIDEVHRRLGTPFFSFVDDTFTTSRDWVLEFVEAVQARDLQRRVRWICLTRPDLVDRPLLEAMRSAGCARVELGIESGSAIGREFLNKGLTEEAVLVGFRAAREAGLSTMGFVILNIPGETAEHVRQTFELVRRADPDYLQVSFLTPYPGTALWERAQSAGWIATERWSEYSFLNNVVLRHGSRPADEVQAEYLRFVRRFYLRPRTVIKLGRLVLDGTTRLRPLLRTLARGLASTVLARRAAE